jgi:LmbE family N-acetylglucosaminyl deacetylase
LYTVLVTATRGEEGEIVDPEIDPEAVRPQLGEVRVEELRRACLQLGIDECHFLGYRDSGMAGTPANTHPACLAQANLHEATGRLVRLIRELRPHVLTCYDENGGYGHPDHITVHRFPSVNRVSLAVKKTSGTAAAWMKSHSCGMGIAMR